MKTDPFQANARVRIGVLISIVLACGSETFAAPPEHKQVPHAVNNAAALIRSGEKIPVHRIPHAESVQATQMETAMRAAHDSTSNIAARDERFGAVATPSTGGPTGCVIDADCDDCDPCTDDDCVAEVCVNANSEQCTLCTDGLVCNGDERCDGIGNCVDATQIKDIAPDPCSSNPGGICDESPLPHIATTPGCVPACEDDADCNDNDPCTGTEFCTLKRCVGGNDDGNGCETNAECDSNRCGGLCRASGTPCGEGAPCVRDGQNFECGWGRCCLDAGGGEYTCSRETHANCTSRWLGVGDLLETENVDNAPGCPIWGSTDPNPNEDMRCPKYESGMVDGNIVDTLGEAGHAPCHPFSEIGDDYELSNFGTGGNFELRTLRWIGGFDVGNGSRMRIRFYDPNGDLVTDTVTNTSVNPGIALRTITFAAGQAIIPARGYITVAPAVAFSPNNLSHWGVTDVPAATGTNDAANVVVRVGDGALTVTSAASLGLANGILAFELVGDKTPFAATGACCRPDSGACTHEFKSACDGIDGLFKGVGTSCRVCDNNPFVKCDDSQLGTDPDCDVCVGGSRNSFPCVDNNDCPDGQCTSGECLSGPNGCGHSACCDENDASCFEVQGGLCSGGSTLCSADADCPAGESCEPDCPSGTVSQGFGTSCDPNCCISPTLANDELDGPFPNTGTPGDNCIEADVNMLHITVPPPGEVTTYTISGNNKNATLGDFADGTCPTAIFNPDGRTRDRGYFVAFSIDACADLRIDFCCTTELSGETFQPQWAFLYTDCDPCTSIVTPRVAGSLTEPPIGANSDSVASGDPFCNSDDPWQTYRSLLPGVYYFPVYSAPGGHFGQFQIHITATACPLSACCIPETTCDGGSSPGASCTQYSDCPNGGVCRQPCELLTELNCAARNGTWHGFGAVPEGENPLVSCTSPDVCDFGACCFGPANCIDATFSGDCDPKSPSTCVDVDFCATAGGVSFHGGARCDSPIDPCPACAIIGDTNCQTPDFDDGSFHIYMSDLTIPPHGATVADDFIPAGNAISQVCVWGVYLDPNRPDSDCAGVVADQFRVRIYADDDFDEIPASPNQPGLLIAERFVSGNAVVRKYIPLGAIEPSALVFAYTLYLGTAIEFPAPNEVYWLEVANITTHLEGDDVNDATEATPNTCYWHWVQVFQDPTQGNNYAHTGTDDRPIEQQACRGGTSVALPCSSSAQCTGGGTCVAGGTGYFGLPRATDLAFCLGSESGPAPFQPPNEPLGACCLCNESWQPDRTLNECREGIGDDDPDLNGIWREANHPQYCVQELGDNCGAAAGAVATGLDCARPPVPGGFIPQGDGLVLYDTSCAENSPAPQLHSGNFLVEDIWRYYVAECTGQLFISGCPSGTMYGGFDSYVAVYHNPANPTSCPCPSTTSGLVADEDESCNGIVDGGSGIAGPFFVVPGDCYMIRAGGWSDSIEGSPTSHGSGILDIQCIGDPCAPAATPVQEHVNIGGTQYPMTKVRRLAINTNVADAGRNLAIRVKAIDLPPGHEVNEGVELYVGPPRRICENSGMVNPPQPNNPPNFGCTTGPLGSRAPWIASLQTEPYYTDWHGVCVSGTCVGGFRTSGDPSCTADADCAGPVNVYHSILTPSTDPQAPSRFEVAAVDEHCGPVQNNPYFSVPLNITLARWGDVLRDNSTNPPRPPDTVVDANDIVGILNKFKNLAASPTKARADIEPRCPDHLILGSDITRALDAFLADAYPFAPGDPTISCP